MLMVLLCLAIMAVGLAFGLPLTWIMRASAARFGQLDAPGERKIHDRPIPATGGVAIVAALVLPIALVLAAAWWAPTSWWSAVHSGVVEHLPGMRDRTPLAGWLALAVMILHVVGLIDDRRDLGAAPKLIVQVLAAALVVALGGIRTLEMFGPVASVVLTILWFVVITNAFNFLDNMDGLSGGVALICAGIFLAAALMGGQWFIAAVLALLVGELLGFLRFNFPPASIFMGDGGSLVVGFVLAFCSVRLTYAEIPPQHMAEATWWAVFTPVVVLAVPLYDLASVTLIRLSQGRSPFRGDTQHFSHRLVRRGLSRSAAVIVIYACTLATGLGGVLLGRVPAWAAALIVIQTLMILLVLALLERGSRAGGPEGGA